MFLTYFLDSFSVIEWICYDHHDLIILAQIFVPCYFIIYIFIKDKYLSHIFYIY